MNFIIVIVTGFTIGLILGGSIYFDPKEPYKLEIMIASTIRNTLVALLTGYSLTSSSSWYNGVGWGLLYGFTFGLVVFFAKGGLKSKDTPYIIPGATIAGGLIGLIIVNYGF